VLYTCFESRKTDNNNGKWYKYVWIATNQPDTKFNTNPNHNPTAKQLAIVSIQLNTGWPKNLANFT